MQQLVSLYLVQVHPLVHLFNLNEPLLQIENLRQDDSLFVALAHLLVERPLHLLQGVDPLEVLPLPFRLPPPDLLQALLDLDHPQRLQLVPSLLVSPRLRLQLLGTPLQLLSLEGLCPLVPDLGVLPQLAHKVTGLLRGRRGWPAAVMLHTRLDLLETAAQSLTHALSLGEYVTLLDVAKSRAAV